MIRVEELKVRLGIDEADTDDDELLKLLELGAVAHFERSTNLYFGPVATHTEYVSGGRRGLVTVSLRAPVVSLTSVEMVPVYGSTEWTQPWPLATYGVFVGERRLDVLGGYYFPAGRRNVRVTYQGGYASKKEPADVRDAVTSMVADTYRKGRATQNPVDTSSEQATPGLVVSTSVQAVIANWRRNAGT